MLPPKQPNPCKACGREISRLSPFCRHCRRPQQSAIVIWLLAAFGLIVIVGYVALCLFEIWKLC